MYRLGADHNEAHWFCYIRAAERTGTIDAIGGLVDAINAAVSIKIAQDQWEAMTGADGAETMGGLVP